MFRFPGERWGVILGTVQLWCIVQFDGLLYSTWAYFPHLCEWDTTEDVDEVVESTVKTLLQLVGTAELH